MIVKNIVVNFDSSGKFLSATKQPMGEIIDGIETGSPNEPIEYSEALEIMNAATP